MIIEQIQSTFDSQQNSSQTVDTSKQIFWSQEITTANWGLATTNQPSIPV